MAAASSAAFGAVGAAPAASWAAFGAVGATPAASWAPFAVAAAATAAAAAGSGFFGRGCLAFSLRLECYLNRTPDF